MRPLIGILASVWVVETGFHAGDERLFAGADYVGAVLQAGGTPVILPLVNSLAAIRGQVQAIDGLLLIGGYDVDPLLYGEEPMPKLGPVFPKRDAYEIAALEIACGQGKPILGICRGIQTINIAFGGTLWQDLSLMEEPTLQHYQNSLKYVPGHTIDISPGTLLYEIFGEEQLRTNSYHHQAIREPAPGFIVNARARDGVIEGIENRDAAILGVQWHPEMMVGEFSIMLNLFRWLINSARTQTV